MLEYLFGQTIYFMSEELEVVGFTVDHNLKIPAVVDITLKNLKTGEEITLEYNDFLNRGGWEYIR